jgi:hypothetical protein
MSYASARFPLVRGLKSVNIGDRIQEAQSQYETLVSGVASQLLSFAYPDGIWTGWAQIELFGDATTDITYLNIIEDNEGGATNQLQSYFVNTTFPDNTTFYIKYPITRLSLDDQNNEIILSAQSVFAGTAPQIKIIYLQLIKIG